MSKFANDLKKLGINDNDFENHINYEYISIFKNPNNLPIHQIHLERNWQELKKELPKDVDILNISSEELRKRYYDRKNEIIPALDKRWLPKLVLYNFEPYIFTLSEEDNIDFITNNVAFIDSLEYLLKCNYHQFWCTILFEQSATVSLRSFLLNPIPPYQMVYLKEEYLDIYNSVYRMFLSVYKRLITVKNSESEHMPLDYAYEKLIQLKLINLPIVNTLALLYKDTDVDFVNGLTNLYFDNTSQLDFKLKEIEETVNQTLLILEMIGGHLCGFDKDAVVVPIAIKPKPPVFNLSWVYTVVNYLLHTMALLNTLLQFYKPSIEICIEQELPFRIPFAYVNIYRELYELLNNREELMLQEILSDRVFEEMNLGRSEFLDVFHMFVSHCLDKTLECMDDDKAQEHLVELYLKLLTTALEDDYFICDYNIKYNVANLNEMFESCTLIDNTRTEFITSCINKLPRQKKLQKLSKLKRQTIEEVFKKFKPPKIEIEQEELIGESSMPHKRFDENDIEIKIGHIVDMFPHLGDGFVLKCLESYHYNADDVINAILEENLPPHLIDTPFDQIRIPPEPEPEKPVLAYFGKKPTYDDALQLLNDKTDLKKLKSFVLEGVQYSNDYLYDDEYDDRDDYNVPIKVADNPLEKEIFVENPNYRGLASDTSESEEEEENVAQGGPSNGDDNRKRMNFCEDPALIRERREAKFRTQNRRPQPKQPQPQPQPENSQQPKSKVVGKPKGQGQTKDVLKARDKKTVNKSSRANHNRKSGAQWKMSRGMI